GESGKRVEEVRVLQHGVMSGAGDPNEGLRGVRGGEQTTPDLEADGLVAIAMGDEYRDVEAPDALEGVEADGARERTHARPEIAHACQRGDDGDPGARATRSEVERHHAAERLAEGDDERRRHPAGALAVVCGHSVAVEAGLAQPSRAAAAPAVVEGKHVEATVGELLQNVWTPRNADAVAVRPQEGRRASRRPTAGPRIPGVEALAVGRGDPPLIHSPRGPRHVRVAAETHDAGDPACVPARACDPPAGCHAERRHAASPAVGANGPRLRRRSSAVMSSRKRRFLNTARTAVAK